MVVISNMVDSESHMHQLTDSISDFLTMRDLCVSRKFVQSWFSASPCATSSLVCWSWYSIFCDFLDECAWMNMVSET